MPAYVLLTWKYENSMDVTSHRKADPMPQPRYSLEPMSTPIQGPTSAVFSFCMPEVPINLALLSNRPKIVSFEEARIFRTYSFWLAIVMVPGQTVERNLVVSGSLSQLTYSSLTSVSLSGFTK